MPKSKKKTTKKKTLPHKHSEVLTVMMVDLCSYTELSGRMKRDNLERMHDIFDELCIEEIKKYHGDVIKKIGDAFLSVFKSPTNALLCATELQKRFRRFDKENDLQGLLKIKAGIHMGEVIIKDKDVYGDAVNIASRLENITRPGHIFFTRSLFLAMNKNEVPTKYLGTVRLKGVQNPVKVFRVKYSFEDELMRRRKIKKTIGNTLVILILLLILYFALKSFIL